MLDKQNQTEIHSRINTLLLFEVYGVWSLRLTAIPVPLTRLSRRLIIPPASQLYKFAPKTSDLTLYLYPL